MALTFTKVDRFVIGNKKMSIYDAAGDTSYPTGGYAVTAANVGLKKIQHVSVGTTTGGYAAAWDKTNSKIKLFRSKDPAAAGGADIVLQEVANATNVSAETLTLKVVGY